MPEKTKLGKASWLAGITAAVVAIAGLVIAYADHSSVGRAAAGSEPSKPVQIQQQGGDQSTQIGQISGAPVSIKNQSSEKSNAIPNVHDMTYDHARQALIQAGWMPAMRSWIEGDSVDVQSGNGPIFWKRGYRELDSCSGTGEAFCLFFFTDPRGNVLRVITAGEEYEDGSAKARVLSAHLQTGEEKKSREAQEKNAQ
jgi:hypothetical protein